MDISIETITPSIAKKWLEFNNGNRPITPAIVQRYANDMQNDKWANDGSPIRFAASGRLLDGQHRLSAVVATGISIDAVVMRGLPDEAFKKMDTGKSRGGADILSIAGYKNANAVASIAAGWIYYKLSGHPASKGGPEKARNADILAACENNPEIIEAAAFHQCNKWLKHHLPAAMTGVLYVAACKRGERDKVLSFFREIISPTTAAIGTSIMPLRDRLIENKAAREKVSKTLIGAYLFKAYRDFRDSRNVKQLKVVLHNGRITKEHFIL